MCPLLLPHGLFDADGMCHREATLRPLVGGDELRIFEAMGVDKADQLLLGGVARLGGYTDLDVATVRALTRGDRQFLLLRLWALEHGERATLVVRCPNPACRARADLPVDIRSLAPEGSLPHRATFEVVTPTGIWRLREPTGELDSRVGEGPRPERAARLWAGLVEATPTGDPLEPDAWPNLPFAVRAALALGLADALRAPDLYFLARCPSCAAGLELQLDPLRLFERRSAGTEERLLAEVHCLAWHYHWSPGDILALTRRERWRYLDLIRRQVEGRPLLDREV
jgi:hypothetical protein